MKERFSTIDLLAVVEHFNRRLLGMRAANIYDIDHKTYLIKLAKSEEKAMLLFESGCRIHTTEFDWPKNMMPSGFAMKLRKHLRTKRLIAVTQLGVDRVLDLQFGSADHAHHLIIELYDRGNVILTDHAYTILSLLRVRTDTDTDVRFAIRETFSMDTIKMDQPVLTKEQVATFLVSAKPNEQLKHVLNPHFVFGPALLTHCIVGAGLPENAKIGTHIDPQKASDVETVLSVLSECFSLFKTLQSTPCRGYLIQKKEKTVALDGKLHSDQEGGGNELVTNLEFHPMLFRQHCSVTFKECETFNKAVDQFFSSKTSQKQDVKVHQMQKAAVKKLDNIQQDHQRRLQALKQTQDEDVFKASLIEVNTDLVEKACLVIRSAVASSMDWGDIHLLVKEAQSRGDPVASCIHGLKLESNQITLLLQQPYFDSDSEDDEIQQKKRKPKKGIKVDLDLSLSVYANAKKYYTSKKSAAKKEQKTIDSSKKALKSAEKKAKQSLKEAAVVSRIQKARKVLWFEKFYWFISSENYLVIGGRDQQQNELIVKKYLNDSDLYVHADLHGASSVVIKNPKGGAVPPKTLNETGVMAVSYSSAWDAKIVTSAWWVYANQVSKTAPSGEYLTTGSFMIRGKKNFLPPCQLTLGFSIMFKLDETCISHHLNERRVKGLDDDASSMMSEAMSELIIEEEPSIHEEEEEEEGDRGLEEHNEGEESPVTVDTSGDEEECGFIDTAIQIQAKGGISFELQRSVSITSSVQDCRSSNLAATDSFQWREDMTPDEEQVSSSHRHLSAKERRLMKKKTKGIVEERGLERNTRDEVHVDNKPAQKKDPEQIHTQYKRGQKSKQKKIKNRYWDQDEDERVMKLELLASSGAPKPVKGKKGKGNRGKKGDLGQTFNPKAKYHQNSKEKTQPVFAGKLHKQLGPLVVEETTQGQEEEEVPIIGSEDETVLVETVVVSEEESTQEDLTCETAPSSSIPVVVTPSNTQSPVNSTIIPTPQILEPKDSEVIDESDDEEKQTLLAEENILQLEESEKNDLVIDSLTGSPVPNDLLLFAIPVCAPYSALHDYKFKVKLVPGTNRRGKAAKTAVYKFIQTKETCQLEKDLLRSIKDNDLSRYFPGKVKMTIPQQILRTKHK